MPMEEEFKRGNIWYRRSEKSSAHLRIQFTVGEVVCVIDGVLKLLLLGDRLC